MPSRPWYQPHFTTVFATLIIAAALVTANGTDRQGDWGWPANCCARVMDYEFTIDPTNYSPPSLPRVKIRWSLLGLSANFISSVVLLAATAFACETWRRNGLRPWQFNLRWLLAVMTIGILIWWMQAHADDIYWWCFGPRSVELGTFHVALRRDQPWHYPFPSYIVWPILFSEGCTLYAAGWLLVRFVHLLRAPRTTAEAVV